VTATLSGVSPVLEVPFTADGEIDVDSFTHLAHHVLGTGVRSVLFPAFASEFYKLTDDERATLSAELHRVATHHPGVTVIASVPDHATRVAVARATRAVEAGAGAVNVLPPYLAGPPPAAVLAHCEAVLAAVAPTPVIVQYAPAQTGSSLDAAAFARLRAAHPNLAAVKVESNPPGRLIAALAALDDPIPAFVGYAGLQMIDAHRRGAVGVQPGCSFVELYLAIWDALEAGDDERAAELHGRLLPWVSYWMQGVELIVAAEKEISVRRGLISSAHCRAPAWRLDAVELRAIDLFCATFSDELGVHP
jgi:4-hydroxy-tetrahydrodipicolinate synthase